jgi:RHS repeat-associated protein
VNTLNELTANTNGGKLTVMGTTTSPATSVAVNGTNALRYNDSTFAATNMPLTTTYTAVASDSYGRSATNTATVSIATNTTFQYDGNGNLTSDGLRSFAYDDENQLLQVWVTNHWLSQFAYDGKMRRRIRQEFMWQSGAWVQTNEVYYVYDGNVVIQERTINNLPTTTYTRGQDLSRSLQGAGGIGGLLAMTLNTQPGPSSSNSMYYHSDGNGNVTMLINGYQGIVAKYLYDAFGNMLSKSGLLADANLYRFSSKEAHLNSGLVYYLLRYYDPNLQRWPNRDPIAEEGGINLYGFVGNSLNNFVDPYGLSGTLIVDATGGSGGSLDGHAWIVYTPDGGRTTSYGTWGPGTAYPGAPSGLYLNTELNRGYSPQGNRSQHLDDSAEQSLMIVINGYSQKGTGAWKYTNPCTSFAHDAWQAGTGENLNTGILNSPVTLVSSINQANVNGYTPAPIVITVPYTFNNVVNTPVVFIQMPTTPPR